MSARAQPRLDEQWAGSLAEFRLLLDSGFLGPWTEMPLDEGGGLRMGCLARPGAGHAVHVLDRRADHVEFACDHGCDEEKIRAKLRVASDLASAPDRLLDELAAFVRRFVVITDAQAAVIALWIVHTHALDAAEATPYLSITSPEKESGKTRLLEVLDALVARAWFTGRATAAVLVRKIDKERPTLLLDESDAAFKGEKEYAEALRGLLNTGYRATGKASLCVGQGASITYRDFSTFGPKAIAGIGELPDTVASRAVPVRLERRARGEHVEPWRERRGRESAAPLRERAEAWASEVGQTLHHAEPEPSHELGDRAQDTAEPLLAIADLAGGLAGACSRRTGRAAWRATDGSGLARRPSARRRAHGLRRPQRGPPGDRRPAGGIARARGCSLVRLAPGPPGHGPRARRSPAPLPRPQSDGSPRRRKHAEGLQARAVRGRLEALPARKPGSYPPQRHNPHWERDCGRNRSATRPRCGG